MHSCCTPRLLQGTLTVVPVWRTMMPPAFTGWPPYTFTPRRLALLSRPFCDGSGASACDVRLHRATGAACAAASP